MSINNNQLLKKRLRRWDDIEVPMDGEFFERLHDKIMCKIEDTEMQPPPNSKPGPPPPLPGLYSRVTEKMWKLIPRS
jgi:hypothetical protein